MKWLSRLFGSTSMLEKTTDAVISAGDKLFYTDEEKAEAAQEMRGWYLKFIDSMQPYNLAMRILAFGVFFVWALHLLLSTGMYVVAFIVCEPAAEACAPALAAKAINAQLTEHINDPFGMVMIFYFGAAGVNGAIRTYLGNKPKS